jgi:O-succinylbenzoate synthase
MLNYFKFQFHPYHYQLRQPLRTSHGIWQVREGIIISLTDSRGKIARGEIAPLPWFGSETISQAWQFCHQLGEKVTKEQILAIADTLPACQFGFESALMELEESREAEEDVYRQYDFESLRYSYLLPPGETALKIWATFAKKDNKSNLHLPITFKWKIGVQSLAEEIAIFQQLTQLLPSEAQLRLDANGGLTLTQAQQWLKLADATGKVEFLEQPLPPEQFEAMLALSDDYATSLALDESVANLSQLATCYQRGWRGVFVIKPAIAGFSSRLEQFCNHHSIDVVFSSVLETKIGRHKILRLAQKLSNPNRAVGFGVDHWLEK